MLKLLVAARLQEGVRQQILENADAGSTETLAKILKVCLDEDLFRYSSAIRALGTWTGISFDNAKPAAVTKFAHFVYECMTDENARARYAESENNIEAYIAHGYGYDRRDTEIEPVTNPDLPSKAAERKQLFADLKEIALRIGNKNRTFTGNPFSFSEITMENTPVIRCMMSLAAYDLDNALIDELTELFPLMNVDQRRQCYAFLMKPETNLRHRAYYRAALEDRSIYVKEMAANRLAVCKLCEEDLEALTASLRSKSSSLRKSVLSILQKQEPARLAPFLRKMLTGKEEYPIQAAIELLLQFQDEHPELRKTCAEELSALQNRTLSTQTEMLLQQLNQSKDQKTEEFTLENGFGVYDPQVAAAFSDDAAAKIKPKNFLQKSFLQKSLSQKNDCYSEGELQKRLISKEEITAILERMNDVFTRHADYEYEVDYYDGSRSRVLFGDLDSGGLRIPAECGRKFNQPITLPMVPFYEEFLEALGEYATDAEKRFVLCYEMCRHHSQYLTNGLESQPWFAALEKKNLAPTYPELNQQFRGRYDQMIEIIMLLPCYYPPHETFTHALKWLRSILVIAGEENLGRERLLKKPTAHPYLNANGNILINFRMFGVLQILLRQTAQSDEDFAGWFLEEYRLEKLVAGKNVHQKLITDEYFPRR